MLATDLSYRKARIRRRGLVITGNMQKKKNEFIFLYLPKIQRKCSSDNMIERFMMMTRLIRATDGFPRTNLIETAAPPWHVAQNPADPGDPVFFLRENGKLTFFSIYVRLPYEGPLDFIL